MIRQTVEIFKTNVENITDATRILSEPQEIYPALRINFDLDDCDHILRVEGFEPDVERIQDYLLQSGYRCNLIG